jgi:endonuclease/exonuclease/phosphatase family metal-dependent hydrolase/flavin-binding protein dodecin
LDEYRIRVMSFNVRGSFRDRGTENAWRKRAALNVATIKRQAPDLIGLQEGQLCNRRAYRKWLKEYEEVRGPRYGNAPPFDFNAILYDPGRLELLDSGGFWLSETPERYSRSWQTRVARSANWALFRAVEPSLTLLHLNTHLDHVSGDARLEGSRLILRELSRLVGRFEEEPTIIVTGDFNCRPGTPPYLTFLEGGFVDTYLAAGNGERPDANTFHAFKGRRYREVRPRRKPRRIDWVLLKDPVGLLRPASHRIVRDHDETTGAYPSDHYPIFTDLVPVGEGRGTKCRVSPAAVEGIPFSGKERSQGGKDTMSVATVTELSAVSTESFEAAIQEGIQRATSTLRNVEGAWIKDMNVMIEDGKVTGYKVNMEITFVLE